MDFFVYGDEFCEERFDNFAAHPESYIQRAIRAGDKSYFMYCGLGAETLCFLLYQVATALLLWCFCLSEQLLFPNEQYTACFSHSY
jgi:hypothetical protein